MVGTDHTVREESTVQKYSESKVSDKNENNVPVSIDTFASSNPGTEMDEFSNAAQKLKGELEKKIEFIDGMWENEYESVRDIDPESYIALDVERLDNLNFDDSDVSLGEESHVEFM